jgi:hypothetical protein
MNPRKVLMGCGVAVLVVLMLVAVGLVVSTLLPKKAQPKLSLSPIFVNINLPLNGAKLPLNEAVRVYAEAIGPTSVHDLELWVDGAFSPTKMDTSPVDRSPLSAVWLWKPSDEGVHRLIVRAIGPDGQAVNSNVVRVSVLPREQIAELQVPTLAPDEIPAATEYGEGEGAPLSFSEGEVVSGEPPPTQPAPPPQPQDPAPGPAGTPGLQGTVNGCDTNLLIQDNSDDEDGFYLYRLDPTSTGFQNVAALDKHAGQGAFAYIDPGLETGAHTYYVTSHKGGVESASNLVNLTVPPGQCMAPLAFGLQDALLTTTKAVDKVYCYLSVNGGPWERIPPGSNTFIYPSAGGFDLSDYLNNLISPPPAGGVTLELECWGWSGDTLVYLGYLKKEVTAGPVDLQAIDLELVAQAIDLSVPETDLQNLSPQIAPPYNVRFVKDYDDCLTQASSASQEATIASICSNMQSGYTIITWRWFPGCWFPKPGEICPYTITDINGYSIYRQDPALGPVQVTSLADPQLHIAMIAPSQGTMISPEYFVRAYKGSQESPDSEHVAGVAPTATVTLHGFTLWTTGMWRKMYEGNFCPDGHGPEFEEGLYAGPYFDVGYYYGSENEPTGFGCYKWYSEFKDGHVKFDLSSIKGQVTGALLRWQEGPPNIRGPGASLPGCGIALLDNEGPIIANYPLDGASGYDVTTQVRAWVQQDAYNAYFTLLDGNPSLGWAPKSQDDVCEERLGDFELDVTYSP